MEHYFSILTESDMSLPIYVTGMGTDETQQMRVRDNSFMNYQIAFCEKGSGKFIIHKKEYYIEQDMFFFFCPGEPHSYYPVEEPWTVKWLLFNGSSAEILTKAAGINQYDAFYLDNPYSFHNCCNQIRNIVSRHDPAEIINVSGIIYSFIVGCTGAINNKRRQKPDPQTRLTRIAATYIRENYSSDITLDELSSLTGVSESYLCRTFKKYYGETPLAYVIHYRINEAKKLIIDEPHLDIKIISERIGFKDPSYFGATFKRYEGCSPKQFRSMFNNAM